MNKKIDKNKRKQKIINNNVHKIRNSTNFIKYNKNIIQKYAINEKIILNDYEINSLKYEKALKFDKRGFIKIYYSILKQNHLIAFSFFPNEDYNLRTVKISLFFISIALYFSINCFFFNDDSMHKLFIELGKYKILNQLPQMIYSTLVSSFINFLLKTFSLSGKNILLIKIHSNYKSALKKGESIEKCEKIKIILFYFISFIFLNFFWYFISCFCAVYINTQKILIHDTIISFTLSMIYPFGICLLPSILRILALKSNKKDKKWLYNLSLLLT